MEQLTGQMAAVQIASMMVVNIHKWLADLIVANANQALFIGNQFMQATTTNAIAANMKELAKTNFYAGR